MESTSARVSHATRPLLSKKTSDMKSAERMAGRRAERAKMEQDMKKELEEKYSKVNQEGPQDTKSSLSMSGLVSGVRRVSVILSVARYKTCAPSAVDIDRRQTTSFPQCVSCSLLPGARRCPSPLLCLSSSPLLFSTSPHPRSNLACRARLLSFLPRLIAPTSHMQPPLIAPAPSPSAVVAADLLNTKGLTYFLLKSLAKGRIGVPPFSLSQLCRVSKVQS